MAIVKVTTKPGTRQELSELVNQEMDEYNSWLREAFKGRAHLLPTEKVLLKTYLMHKLEETSVIKGKE